MARKRKGKGCCEALLKELGEDVAKDALNALSEGADLVVDDARRRAPVRSGKLKSSIQKVISKNGRRVVIKASAENDKGYDYAPIVEYDPNKKHPFLHPALSAQREKALEGVVEAIRRAIKKNAKP